MDDVAEPRYAIAMPPYFSFSTASKQALKVQ